MSTSPMVTWGPQSLGAHLPERHLTVASLGKRRYILDTGSAKHIRKAFYYDA